jgi:phosphoserine phosphatase RsbX
VDDPGRSGPFQWAVAERPAPGQATSGDAWVVQTTARQLFLSLIDGLGHGPEAANAAKDAVDTLKQHPADPLDELLHACHRKLMGTRGAAITLVRVDPRTETIGWIGVGNVVAVLVRAGPLGPRAVTSAFLVGGLVGYRLPTLRPRTIPLCQGDLIVMATDGVHPSFTEHVRLGGSVGQVVKSILDYSAQSTDDATILAACYRDGQP